MIDFQEAATDTCLQLAPRGYGQSTILTITRAVYEILRPFRAFENSRRYSTRGGRTRRRDCLP